MFVCVCVFECEKPGVPEGSVAKGAVKVKGVTIAAMIGERVTTAAMRGDSVTTAAMRVDRVTTAAMIGECITIAAMRFFLVKSIKTEFLLKSKSTSILII